VALKGFKDFVLTPKFCSAACATSMAIYKVGSYVRSRADGPETLLQVLTQIEADGQVGSDADVVVVRLFAVCWGGRAQDVWTIGCEMRTRIPTDPDAATANRDNQRRAIFSTRCTVSFKCFLIPLIQQWGLSPPHTAVGPITPHTAVGPFTPHTVAGPFHPVAPPRGWQLLYYFDRTYGPRNSTA
jgi:hypothetical protein